MGGEREESLVGSGDPLSMNVKVVAAAAAAAAAVAVAVAFPPILLRR